MRKTILLLPLLAVASFAGPPGICWDVDIGDAKSLPWGDTAFGAANGYDRARTVPDALALLDANAPVLVRMETIRRAVLYVGEDAARRSALQRALFERVLDAEAAGAPDALAWFDAGYAQGCFEQMFDDGGSKGYRWVRHARKLRGANAAMEYACAVLSLMPGHPERAAFAGHLERARAGAKQDALLARNVERFEKLAKPVLGVK
jgi:hypothetical protein